ncbi:MAG: hypothetical protein R3C02_07735 [Planctomycetaceae bacterium]
MGQIIASVLMGLGQMERNPAGNGSGLGCGGAEGRQVCGTEARHNKGHTTTSGRAAGPRAERRRDCHGGWVSPGGVVQRYLKQA